jgi:hypothetical protein
MRNAILIVFVLVAVTAYSQISINGISPSNGSTNVPLNTVIKMWFSAPLDTTKPFGSLQGLFTSIDTLIRQWYSPSADTVYFDVRLGPSTPYFILVYWVPGQGGATIASPYSFEFTTGSAFSGVNVSGTVTSTAPGVTASYSFVGLSRNSVVGSDPHFVAGAIANIDGNFTIHHVPSITVYPVAAKDGNGDGTIDPSTGDPVGIAPPVNVSSFDITGLFINIGPTPPVTFVAAVDSATHFKNAYLPGFLLKQVQLWDSDSLGRAINDQWEFAYYNPTTDSGIQVRVESFGTSARPLDYWTRQNAVASNPITNIGSAATSDVFVTKAEAAGGLAFRNQSEPPSYVFHRTILLGQLQYSQFAGLPPNPAQLYWGAQYHFDVQINDTTSNTMVSKFFIGDFTTGDILVVTGVDDATKKPVPETYSLAQNYPNPFNPTTAISYQLASGGDVTLKVYDPLGREVETLVKGHQDAGKYTIQFNANTLASGIYFYRLTAGNFVATKKVVLLK